MSTTKDTRPPLTAQRLRELLDYDPDTGVFRWRKRTGAPGPGIAGKRAGYRNQALGYRAITIDYRGYSEHRLAWLYVHGRWPQSGMQIDHVNGDPADNRLCNLREATPGQNKVNVHRLCITNSLGVRGVRLERTTGRYVASVTVDGQNHHLGTFDTLDEAADAAREARVRLFGEFAGTV